MKLSDHRKDELEALLEAVTYRLQNCRLDSLKIKLNAWITRINLALNSYENNKR